MKIVFLGFASTFTPGMSYQDNLLCLEMLRRGHQITYLSNPEKFVDGIICETGFEDTILENGLHLIRLPYVKFGPNIITKKLRVFRGVAKILNQVQPDVVFCHNTQYWPILDAAKYKRNNPQTKLYADTHTADYNSASNWFSLHFLHRVYYRWLFKKAVDNLDKYLYVGDNERDFAIENYGARAELMEFYPLGGIVLDDDAYKHYRELKRKELNIGTDEILCIHSGKLDSLKRSKELLEAFTEVDNNKLKLVIIGSIPDDQKEDLMKLINSDPRIQYLGWKTGDELQQYLCAGDLYCQPGSVSATLQNAICKGCAIMAYPHVSYTGELNCGQFVYVKTKADIIDCFKRIVDKELSIDELKNNSNKCGRELLDYRKLADRITSDV